MVQLVAELQPLFLGLVLAWAGGYKLAGRAPASSAATNVLGTVRRARMGFQLVGAIELAIASLLLLPPVSPADGWLAAGLVGGFVGYLIVSRRVAPQSSCGCMSSRAGPVTWRSYARAGLLVVVGLATTQADALWSHRLVEEPKVSAVVLASEALVFLAVSPDLDQVWLRRARQLWARLRPHPFAATAAIGAEPLHAALWRLHHSETYRAAVPLLRSDVLDSWEEGPWRLVSYAAVRGGEPVTAVFAIPEADTTEEIRLALVAEPPGDEPAAPGIPTLAPIH